ncbi:MAG: anion permease [Candidatus Tectomicrobia bacterium]|nr:anion permease [Candidatus Tectomicrobia bacterium]
MIVLLPQPNGLSLPAQRAFAGATFILVLWITRAIPVPASVLLLGLLLRGLGAVPSLGAGFGGFASPVVAFLLGIFGIAHAVVSTGLARRFSRLLLRRARGGVVRLYVQQLFLFCGGAYVVPSAITRSSIMIPVYRDVLRRLRSGSGGEPGSRLGRLVMLPHAVLNAAASSALLTGGLASITAASLLGGVSWLRWFAAMALPYYLFIAAAGGLLLMCFGGASGDAAPAAGVADGPEPRRAPWSRGEAQALVTLTAVSLLWVTDFLHGFHPAFPALLAAAALLAPRLGVAEWRDFLRQVSWSQLFLVAGSLTLARVLVETGAAAWLAARLFSSLGAGSYPVWAMALVILLLSALVHAIVPNVPGSLAVLIPVLTPLAARLGLPPLVAGFIMTMAVDTLVFYPYQSVLALMVYETGYVRTIDLALSGMLFMVLLMALVLLLFLPFWGLVLERWGAA